tara:strand:+ start:552 stop:1310 length:759 start_codon:yes stop_codon:yes gene_type:complete
MSLDKNKNKHSFFGDNPRYWIGKIVEIDKSGSQRTLVSGGSWGYRYRVRLLADYSNQDAVKDDDVFVAQVLVPVTAGTGAAGRSETVKLSQNDMVLGIFLGADETAPVILHAFVRSSQWQPDNSGSKFGVGSGFTKKVKPGLLKNQEKSETNVPAIPILEKKASKGNGKGKATPVGQLKNLAGGTDEENAVGAFGKLSGNAEPLTGVEKAQKLARERIESGKTIQQVKDANTQAMRDRARERNAAFRAQNYE